MIPEVSLFHTAIGLLVALVFGGLVAFLGVGRILRRWPVNPLTARRIRRFRAMKVGWLAFVLIVSGFTASLFLELYCNNRPLYIRWRDHARWPALASWGNFVLPWAPFDDTVPARDFGLKSEGELDARAYARWVHRPGTLEEQARQLEADADSDERMFRETMAEEARKQRLAYSEATPLPPWKKKEIDRQREQAADFRALEQAFRTGAATIVMPLYPFSPREQLLSLPGSPPHAWFQPGMPILGTDAEGKDVLSQLLYGFRISLAFGVIVSVVGYCVGIAIGGAMGYFGGWFDILVQRFIEIWSAIPFLYTIMIVASAIRPSFWTLALILIVMQVWISITYYERGEFYREKARDYVQAARALGLSDAKIMFRHILPNALVPVVTFLPFDIVAFMSELVALDFLGFGLPPGTPSWGHLLEQGSANIVNYPHLVWVPVIAFAGTLLCVVFIGEAVREAFDPRPFARLR
jgi:microcin C transport system permease protein